MTSIQLSQGECIIEDLDFDGTKVWIYGKLNGKDIKKIRRALRRLDIDMSLSEVFYSRSRGMLDHREAISAYNSWKKNRKKP